MSHHTLMQTELTDLAELKATLEGLGCEVRETRRQFQTKDGRVHRPEVCLEITALPSLGHRPPPTGPPPASRPDPQEESVLAFVKFGSTFELVADGRDFSRDDQEQLKNIVTSYHAYRLTKEKLDDLLSPANMCDPRLVPTDGGAA